MKQVAKIVIIDQNDLYLLLYRNNHPIFGNDPDLPGGTIEDGESTIDATIRELREEVCITIEKSMLKKVISSRNYSLHGTNYTLFTIKLDESPEITLSWEHTSYSWLSYTNFLEKIKNANDTYMHMVYDALT